MRGIVNLRLMGRFGNQMHQYAFAHAYCQQHDCELRNDAWVGQRLFTIPPRNPIRERFPTRIVSELDIQHGEVDIELNGYFQTQSSLIYTRTDVRNLFAWQPEVAEHMPSKPDLLLAHLRRGDYFGYGYPVVSRRSYEAACTDYNLPLASIQYISEETPTPGYGPDFLPDFWRLAHAHTLLRANSSFSWWAATLADPAQQVYSPVVDGLAGGQEHDCLFVPSNHPRFTNLPYVTDLHLAP